MLTPSAMEETILYKFPYFFSLVTSLKEDSPLSYLTIPIFSRSQRHFHKVSEFRDFVCIMSEKLVVLTPLSHVTFSSPLEWVISLEDRTFHFLRGEGFLHVFGQEVD